MVIQVIAILHCHIVYVWSYCVLLESLDTTVGSTVQGLAARKIQDEALARTYMALEAKKLRAMWLKKQLQQHGEDLAKLFIDLEDSQH